MVDIELQVKMKFDISSLVFTSPASFFFVFVQIYSSVEFVFCSSFSQTEAHSRTSILTFLALMAKNDSSPNGKNAIANNNGTTKAPFGITSSRSNNYLQQSSLGSVRRLISDTEQYATPPNRVCMNIQCDLCIFQY